MDSTSTLLLDHGWGALVPSVEKSPEGNPGLFGVTQRGGCHVPCPHDRVLPGREPEFHDGEEHEWSEEYHPVSRGHLALRCISACNSQPTRRGRENEIVGTEAGMSAHCRACWFPNCGGFAVVFDQDILGGVIPSQLVGWLAFHSQKDE